MILTYDQYDRMEEACDRIRQTIEQHDSTDKKYFEPYTKWPTVAVLQEMDVEHHVDEFFPYLFFWYTQKFAPEEMSDSDEYRSSMKYIKKLIDRSVIFEE